MIQIYNMDVMKALKKMPDESVDMQITSPPYWGLRSYGKDVEMDWGDGYIGELGLEPTFDLYIKHLCDIFDEVKRVLKKDGTCWVNLGDTYSGTGTGEGTGNFTLKNNPGAMKPKLDLDPKLPARKRGREMVNTQIQAKCLCAIPERFMIEMINRGWILRNKIIWHKPNHMPTSVKDRFANSWEYLFFFSKSKKYYFDLDAVREPHKTETLKRNEYGHSGDGNITAIGRKREPGEFANPKGKNPDDVIVHKQDVMALKNKNMYEGFNARYVPNPKGTIPDDIVKSKYIGTEGHSDRAGLQREPTLRERRIHEVIQIQIANYLKPKTKSFEKILDEKFGQHKWTHWIRKDESGASLPSPEDWWKLKEILKFDDIYDKIMTEIEVYLDDGMMWKNKPKNPSDFWDITTRGYPEAHFAVFPPALVERPIKTTPMWICKKCGKARERIMERTVPKMGVDLPVSNPTKIEEANKLSKNSALRIKGGDKYAEWKANNPDKMLGWTDCKCGVGFKPSVIMDIFAGSGTTLKVARDLGRDSIGIEIKKEYVELIKKRLFKGNQPLVNDFEVIT